MKTRRRHQRMAILTVAEDIYLRCKREYEFRTPRKEPTIDYNHLNLPKKVNFGGDGNLRYTYDATGNKLTKTVELDGNAEIGRYRLFRQFPV